MSRGLIPKLPADIAVPGRVIADGAVNIAVNVQVNVFAVEDIGVAGIGATEAPVPSEELFPVVGAGGRVIGEAAVVLCSRHDDAGADVTGCAIELRHPVGVVELGPAGNPRRLRVV